jgi:hypothetical protein
MKSYYFTIMKTLQTVAITLLFLAGMLSCETDQENPKPEQPSKGTPTEVGKPLGTVTSKMIGAQGGSISTPDGKLTLTFPAGALSKETNITIRPVENKAWGGVGTSYEFGPDGSEFAKPVMFTYRYNDKEMSGASLDNLALAFQDQAKIWQMTAPLTVNQTQKTITGAIRHFSWWSMITRYKLTPEYDTVLIKQIKELQVEFLDNGEWPWTDSKNPPAELPLLYPLNAPKLADRTDIAKIYLNGVDCTTTLPKDQTSGLLGFANKGNKAVIMYTAPNNKPNAAYNPVAISVELQHTSKARLLLVSNLYIDTENTFSIDGSDPTSIAINAAYGAGSLSISFEDNMGNVMQVYTQHFEPGSYAFNTTDTYVGARHYPKKKQGASIYRHCREDKTESGRIVIDKIYQSNGKTIMQGSVSGKVCTRHETDEKCNIIVHETMSVNARFTVVVLR